MIIFIIFLSFLHNLFAQDAPFGVYNGLDSTQIPGLSFNQFDSLQTSEPIVQKKQENITYCSNCCQPYNNGAVHLGRKVSEIELYLLLISSPVRISGSTFFSSVI